MATSLDLDLLARAAADDVAAFTELYHRHHRSVYRQAFAVVRSGEEAREITQETFIIGWNKRRATTLVGESYLPWLLATAWHVAQNRKRSIDRHPTVPHDEESVELSHQVDVEEVAMRRLLVRRVEQEVAQMSELDRSIYTLCVLDGLSYDDAAAQLGVNVTSVRNRLSRLRARLRARFASERDL